VQAPDLNLLVVFNQLYQDRKVSLTAHNLGLSQPTVSAALARLRKTMNDELFVRTPRGMQPALIFPLPYSPIHLVAVGRGRLPRRAGRNNLI